MSNLGRPFLIIVGLVSILVAAAGCATVADGTRSLVLGADPALVVDGHHYAMVAVDVRTAESLRVSMISTEVDSFLTLIAPDQSVRDDDQSAGGSDAQIEIDSPMPGRWLIVATTYAPDERGTAKLAIEPEAFADAADATLPEALAPVLVAGRGARAEAAWSSHDLARQEADIAKLSDWLRDAAQRDLINAIINEKLAELGSKRGRLQKVLATSTEADGNAAMVDAMEGRADTAVERELLLEAVAEIEAIELGLQAAATALAGIGALETIVAGGEGIHWVIQELTAETKVNREGFDLIEGMLKQRRETLAWRLVAGDVVVLGERGPLPSDDGPMLINTAIDRQLYLDETALGTERGPSEGGVQVGGNANNLTLVNRNTNAAIGKDATATTRIGSVQDSKIGGNLNNLTLVNRNTNATIGQNATANTRIGSVEDSTIGGNLNDLTLTNRNTNAAIGQNATANTRIGSVEDSTIGGNLNNLTLTNRNTNAAIGQNATANTRIGSVEDSTIGGNLNNLTLTNRNTNAAIGQNATVNTRIGASADVTESTFVPRGADPLAALMPTLHPWPPPAASTHTDLPRDLIDPEADPELTLGEVDKRITSALADAGYAGHSYSGVPGGFAIATPVERFVPDGTPLDRNSRWSTKLPPLRNFSLTEYIRALFTAKAGHFRVLLFVVTDQPFHTESARARLKTVRAWARQGVVRLAPELRDQVYTHDHGTTVLVYEFEKVRGSGVAQVVFEDPSMLAPAHLRSAGILRALGGS